MFHVKHEVWPGDGPPDLDPQAASALDRYVELLSSRGAQLGLVATGDLDQLRSRHVFDCLRAVSVLPAQARTLCDLGSGAGLPGLVLALAVPELQVALTEVRRTRIAFLELAIDRVPVPNARVVRGVSAAEGPFDVCTARAFRDAATAWAAAEPLLGPEGILVYWAGSSFDPDREVPPSVRAVLTDSLASMGPLAIMSRQ